LAVVALEDSFPAKITGVHPEYRVLLKVVSTDILTTSYWLHVELEKNILKKATIFKNCF
jgi:hypothetical protein